MTHPTHFQFLTAGDGKCFLYSLNGSTSTAKTVTREIKTLNEPKVHGKKVKEDSPPDNTYADFDVDVFVIHL